MKTKKTKQNAAAVVGATPSVLGPTPGSDIPFHGGAGQQKRAAAEDVLRSADTGVKQPATIKTVKFHTLPPRSEIVEKENAQGGSDTAGIRFKERTKAEGALTGLGQLSASIWAKTSVSKGGAKDPAAAPFAKAASIMANKMEIDGDERAALLSTEGFKAYADEMVWGVRGPGESDDAPLDEDDPLQVHGRLREVWRSWRKLPVVQQRKWGDKQLTQDMALALRRAAGAGKPLAKGRKAASSVSTAEHVSRSSKGRSKKSDGWRYVAAPKHAPKTSRSAAVEPEQQEEEEEEEEEEPQRTGSGRNRKDQQGKRAKKLSTAGSAGDQVQEEEAVDRQYDAVRVSETKLDEEYRRAEALRFSKAALLAEMRSWEEEDEDVDAAAAAGMTVDELRKQRKEAAEATAAAEAAKENESADANGVEAAEDEDDDVPAGSSRAAASKGKKRKAAGAGSLNKATGSRRSGRASRKVQQRVESDDGDAEMADGSDDEEAAAVAEEAELDKALAEADDSDEDNEDDGDKDAGDEESEEEKEQSPPAKKARKIPKAPAAASNGKPRASMDKKTEKTSKRKESSEVPAASAPAAAKPTGKKAKKVDTSSIKVEGNSRKRKTIEAAAADMPEAKEAGTSAAAAASGGRQRSKASARAAQSPARKSQRQQKEQEAQQQQADEDNGPAVSGAGKSAEPRRGRPAGGAQAARIEALEKKLFSNTRRNSYGRADSPGVARTRSDALAAEAAKQRPSRLGKNKN